MRPFRLFVVILAISSLCSALSNEPLAVLTFEMHGDHIFIKVTVNGLEDLNFIFDTGASSTVVSAQLAEKLKLVNGKDSIAMGAGGNKKIQYYDHNFLKVGKILLKNAVLAKVSLQHLMLRIGRKIDGIIGLALLHNHAINLDFEKETITFYPSSHQAKLAEGHALMVRMSEIGIPYIMARLELVTGKRLYGYFLLDSGAGQPLIINTPFSKKYQLSDQIGKYFQVQLSGLTLHTNPSLMGRIHAFVIGKYRIRDLPVACSQTLAGVNALPQFAGLIGSPLLRHFNIYLNITQKRVIFQPNSFYGDKFKIDGSGLRLGLAFRASVVQIYEIIDGSPGQKAGAKIGDKLIIVNGSWINPDSLLKIRELFKIPGQRISLVVRRNGRLMPVVFYVKELI